MKIKTFWADRSGAVLSEFVLLSGALIVGVSTTLATLNMSLASSMEAVSSELISECPLSHALSVSNPAGLTKATCR